MAESEPLIRENPNMTSSNYFHYVLVFPNFLSNKPEVMEPLKRLVPLIKCKEIFNAVFKIIETEQECENNKKPLTERAKWIYEEWVSFAKDTVNGQVEWRMFLKKVVNVLIKILQEELFLKLHMFFSRDHDEIFVKMRATERNLRVQADLMDYMVQVSVTRPHHQYSDESDDVFPKNSYSRVCPYGEFQNSIKYQTKDTNLFNIYKTYSIDDKKAKDEGEMHSVFRYKDKVKIIVAMISSTVDLGVLLENQIISQNYCLHNETTLDYLKDNWASFQHFYRSQDLKAIRCYFGEKIAVYFAYLSYYIYWLILPAILGLAAYVAEKIDKDLFAFEDNLDFYELLLLVFSLTISLSSTLLDQLWVRRENELAWMWGTVDMIEVEQQRPTFKGEYKTDPITGQKRKVPSRRTFAKIKRSFGFSVTLTFTVCVLAMIIGIFIAKRDYEGYVTYFSLLNAFQIKVMNFAHRIIAKKLTEWENYEFDSEFNDALTIKLYLFQFINSYTSLFYIAFIKDNCQVGGCMAELSGQLFWILVFNTGMNLMELGFPYLKMKLAIYNERRKVEIHNVEHSHTYRLNLSQVEVESKLAVYETPLDDYMELIINYGYVVMFSVAYPLFPLFSLVLNILEIRVDAFKLCFLSQRPYPTPSNSIGKWLMILRAVSMFGALTNTAILVFTKDVFDLNSNGHRYLNGQMWVRFIILEHFLLLFKFLLMAAMSRTPSVVKSGLIWSKRIAEEKIYGKATDFEDQKRIRNLYFTKDDNSEEIVLDYKHIRNDDY